MKLFVGNPTAHKAIFGFRMPETGRVVQVEIQQGGQELIGDFDTPIMDEILKQNEIYGLADAATVGKRTKGVAPRTLIYSLGKPIPQNRLTDAVDAVDEALVEEGEEMRKAVAIAADQAISGALQEQLGPGGARMKSTTIEVREDPRPDRDPIGRDETVQVVHDPALAEKKGARRK